MRPISATMLGIAVVLPALMLRPGLSKSRGRAFKGER
jgi:hypothetical protein